MSNSKYIHAHQMKITGAISCLVENGFIESALILTYTGIDQMSWLASLSQESNGNDFKAWVDKYLMPSTNLGCSPDDIWAARNALVHTATAESRDFHRSKAKRIYYVSGSIVCTENKSTDTVIIDAISLIVAFINGALTFISYIEADEERLSAAAKKAEAILAFSSLQ